ncbi:MAG: macro domain-containing protein [Planctomycetota bacterium]|nr:macro domain-containing protein [Planctomycetota bacterium]
MIRIVQGDLTAQAVDAIVNAANTDLQLGAGVAGAIRKKGGPSIQAECDAHGPVELGGAALTGAGDLPAKHVIHAAGMKLGGRVSEASLLDATRNSLRLAAEHGLTSLAFPAIGTGVGGFPLEACARLMLAEARRHLESGRTSVKEIAFVLFDEASCAAFQAAAEDLGIETAE